MCEVKINISENEHKFKVRLVLRTIFHVLCVCLHYCISLYGAMLLFTIDEELLKIPVLQDAKRFAALFLTNWNYLFQTVFLSLSLIYDVLEWLDKHQSDFGKKLSYYRDIIFSGLVVPFTMFISSMFWIVYSIDRELVFPVVYDQVVPWWFNHCVHTNITIVLLVETVLQARRYPRCKILELGLVGGVGILYAIVYYSIYFFTGRWLYAVFGIMTWWQVCLYQLLIWGSTFVFYYVQFPVNRIFHREVTEDIKNIEVETIQNGVDKNDQSNIPGDSWRLKYRPVKSQFENSSL